MDASAHDLRLVGDGAAGLRTATSAANLKFQANRRRTNVKPIRSHTLSVKGGPPVWSMLTTAWTIVHTTPFFSCDRLCDEGVVEAFVKEAALKVVQEIEESPRKRMR